MPQPKSSNEFTSKLIETVKKHECIWNTTLMEHSRRNVIEDAWKQITEELESSGFKLAVTCREKWKNVKTGFLRNIGEYTSRNRPNSAKKKFYLYNEMKFLLPFIKKVNNHKSKKSEITFENEEEIQYCGMDDTLNNINTDTLTPFTNEDSNDKDYNSSNPVTVPSLMTNNDPFQSITNENDEIDNQSSELNEMINDKIITVIPKFQVENNSSSAVTEHTEEEKTSKSKPKLKSRKRSYPKQNAIVDELELEILKYLKRKRKSKKQITDDECSLMKFFKSNMPDILSLSKKNQRVFKMKMINIIEELQEN